jgi:hypothetical protein
MDRGAPVEEIPWGSGGGERRGVGERRKRKKRIGKRKRKKKKIEKINCLF